MAPSSHTVKVQVTDNGGLTAVDAATVNVIFNWAGFFQPVDNLPELNVPKPAAPSRSSSAWAATRA